MVVGLGGRGFGGNRAMTNEGVFAKVAGNHCRLHPISAYLQDMYRGGEHGGI